MRVKVRKLRTGYATKGLHGAGGGGRESSNAYELLMPDHMSQGVHYWQPPYPKKTWLLMNTWLMEAMVKTPYQTPGRP